MNRLEATRKAGKLLTGASLMLGLWISPFSGALAAERPYRPNCPCPPGYSSPYYSAPGAMPSPGAPTPAQPGQAAPDGTSPSDAGQQNQAQQQDQAQQQADFSQSADSSRANPAPGMNTPQLGRLDQGNRLNLFDNMSAAPMNKVWFGFQYSSGINTGIAPSGDFISFTGLSLSQAQSFLETAYGKPGLFAQQRQATYRAGAEVLLTSDASIAVQGQYFTNATSDSPYGDDWANPQILLKQVLARDCDTIVAATLGITINTGDNEGSINENTTKLYPGLLYYETLSRNLFTQGGFQFGIPTSSDQIYTFDWSTSIGYWLYRDCSLDSCCCCNSGRITGIIPQVNLLGKHLIGDGTRYNAYGIPTTPLSSPFGSLPLVVYNEPTDVIDLSAGTLIMLGSDIQVGLGYSLPLTQQETRQNEFISYVNYLF